MRILRREIGQCRHIARGAAAKDTAEGGDAVERGAKGLPKGAFAAAHHIVRPGGEKRERFERYALQQGAQGRLFKEGQMRLVRTVEALDTVDIVGHFDNGHPARTKALRHAFQQPGGVGEMLEHMAEDDHIMLARAKFAMRDRPALPGVGVERNLVRLQRGGGITLAQCAQIVAVTRADLEDGRDIRPPVLGDQPSPASASARLAYQCCVASVSCPALPTLR